MSRKILDTDILKLDRKTVDVQKIIFKLWEVRNNPRKVDELSEILSVFADEKEVLQDIEFYLPQLAHMIIHLDPHSSSRGLEYLAMAISHSSIHTALLLCFSFVAAMEDYQPELPNGKHNDNCNPFLFSRCARLLQGVERSVIYGSLAFENITDECLGKVLASSGNSGKHTKATTSAVAAAATNYQDRQLQSQELTNNNNLTTTSTDSDASHRSRSSTNAISRQQLAQQFLSTASTTFDGQRNGYLYYKRNERKTSFSLKPWKRRFFVVDQRVLLCYREPHVVNPLRAISLTNCRVYSIDSNKYGNTCFEVFNEANNTKYILRADNEAQRDEWVQFIQREIHEAPLMANSNDKTTQDNTNLNSTTSNSIGGFNRTTTPTISEEDMTPIQRKRFCYFKQMRIFLTNVTNICERLRFKERGVRKFFLRRDLQELSIPPFIYLPLCNSTDTFHTTLRAVHKEAYAFSTKARCPALMLFEIEEHPYTIDVATFLSTELERYREEDVILPGLDIITKYTGATIISDDNHELYDNHLNNNTLENDDLYSDLLDNEKHGSKRQALYESKFYATTLNRTAWAPKGTGFCRLNTLEYDISCIPRENINNTINTMSMSDIHVNINEQKEDHNTSNISMNRRSFRTTNTTTTNLTSTPTSTLTNTPANTSNNLPTTTTAAGALGETFHQKTQRLRSLSPYAALPHWKIGGLIAKSNDDLRQEVFVMQIMTFFQQIFRSSNKPLYMHTYKIVSTSKTTGLIELIIDATSLDGLKKSQNYPHSLRRWYEISFGYTGDNVVSERFNNAIENFVSSLAAYSIVTYLLAIKDRHNGNIMIDKDGHIIHIDFGFVFGLAPGKAFSMETAPFKLHKDFIEVMGGTKSNIFMDYTNRCIEAFQLARQHGEEISKIMEIMSYHSNYPAFQYNPNAIRDFQRKLQLNQPDQKIPGIVKGLIASSCNHTGTDLYDSFQLATNGIAK